MPYKLKKVAGKLQLLKGKQVVAKNTTKARAKKQIAAIEISEMKRMPMREHLEYKKKLHKDMKIKNIKY